MPWMIAKRGEEYCVYKKDADGKPVGKTKGCHSTRKKAERQMAALHTNVLESTVLAFEDIRDRLRVALENRYAVDTNSVLGVWLKKTLPDSVVYEYDGKLWQVSYSLDNVGNVDLGSDTKEVLEDFVPIQEHVGMTTIAEIGRGLYRILESEKGSDNLRFEGCVLVDEVLSQAGKGRYYSTEFNDRCMEATNLYLSAGGIVTIYSRHGRAAGESGRALYPTGLPVGRVTKPLWRKGAEILYEAMISPTSEGSDVMVLIRDEVLQPTSLRASRYSSRMRALEDSSIVEEMVSAVIVGIDLCEQSGIEGAGIRRVLEEAPQWKDLTEEDGTMTYEELTLELLVENRQDLLDAHATPLLEARVAEIATLADANAALKQQLATATAAAEAAAASTPDAGRLAVLEACSCGLSRIMADKLTASGLNTAETIAPVLEGIRASSLQELVADTPAPAAAPVLESVAGVTNILNTDPSGSVPGAVDAPGQAPEEQRILELAQGSRSRRKRS